MNEVGKKRKKRVHKVNEDKRNLQQQWTDLQEQLKLLEEHKNIIITERQKIDAQKQQLAEAQYKNLRNVTQEATPIVIKSVSNIGNLREFTLNDDWILWIEKFECYLLVNEVAEEKKVPLFMTLLNMEAYALLRNLCAPSLPHTKCLGDLNKVMRDYLKPAPSVITARRRFRESRQKQGEKIKEYVANLKALSLHCDFGATLESELRDQFVSGVENDNLKKQLLEETNLTFRRATNLATLLEGATRYGSQTQSAKETNINDRRQPQNGESPNSNGGQFCDGRRNFRAQLMALIYWHNPIYSFGTLGAILCVVHLMFYINLINMLAQTSLFILGGSIAFRIFEIIFQAVQKTPAGNPFKGILDVDLTLPAEKVHEFADLVVPHANAAVVELRRLFLVEDFVNSLKFGIILCLLTSLGSLINGLTLINVGVVALFILPKAYEMNKM